VAKLNWIPLKLSHPDELQLDTTFRCGQAFRWKYRTMESPELSYWTGVIDERVFALRQTNDDVLYSLISPQQHDESKIRKILHDYFYLDVSLVSLFQDWSKDSNFEVRKDRFKGLRLLRQDPVECVFSFICSQNNNIGRITKMIESLCTRYGKLILDVDHDKYYDFPTLDSLAQAQESDLRDMGFGYRARYVPAAANQIVEKGGVDWLWKLRGLPKKEVQMELISLMGVGKKVADCISLFSLDKLDCIPVDTHVWQIAQTYMPKLRGKRLNESIYDEIGDFFKRRFGDKCGWAHTILFAAELTAFKVTKTDIKIETTSSLSSSYSSSSSEILIEETTTIKKEETIITSSKRRSSGSTSIKKNDKTTKVPISKRRKST